MEDTIQLAVFRLDELRYALHLDAVERVIAATAATPLPDAPDIVIGVINVHGTIIPLLNIRRRFRLPEKDLDVDDHIIIGHTKRRMVALVVDKVMGVLEVPQKELTAANEIVPGIEYVEGVTKLKDGIIFIHNLNKFLSLEEEKKLDEVL